MTGPVGNSEQWPDPSQALLPARLLGRWVSRHPVETHFLMKLSHVAKEKFNLPRAYNRFGMPTFQAFSLSLFTGRGHTSKKPYFPLQCAMSMALWVVWFEVFSPQATAVHGILSFSVCRTRPYNATCSFSLYCCSAHIACGGVLVKGKVYFNPEDWVRHRMKIIIIVGLRLLIFCEITLENEIRIFFSSISNRENTKINAFKFPFFQENGLEIPLFKLIIYSSWTQHFNVAITSFSWVKNSNWPNQNICTVRWYWYMYYNTCR